jgi:hypothetical protein
MKLTLCIAKALLGLAVVVLSNGDDYILAAGVGHMLLAPFWWYAL